jgi:hypothetical protein
MYFRIKSAVLRLGLVSGVYISKLKPTSKETIEAFFANLRENSAQVDLVRIGGAGDGGYLVPNDLSGVHFCMSPGVAETSCFEFQLASDYDITCCLADFSVDAPAVNHPLFHFTKKFVSSYNDEQNMRLTDWVHASEDRYGKGDLLLQMDVEGAEYSVLQEVSEETLAKFRIVIIEFHYVDRIFDRNDFALIKQVFDKLLKQFYIVHIHPNNSGHTSALNGIDVPTVLEFTFLRRDRVTDSSPLSFEPHILDQPNTKRNPDLALPACWRG